MGENAAATSQTGSFAYVSMPPGTDASGVSVSIQREGDAALPTEVPMVDAGFDPVAIAAQVGDTLLIVTHDARGGSQPGFGVVSRLRPPSVVRTVPAAQRTDVPLNTGVVIVFTEPMDSASVVNGITLQLDGVVVPSTITLTLTGGGAIQVAVQPNAPLTPGSTYQIVISSTVLDLLGQSLTAPVLIPFTTVSGATTGSSDLTITSFTMVDFHDTRLVPFEYAPQLLITNPVGSPTAHITGFAAVTLGTFPATAEQPVCISGVNIAPGQTVQVFTPVDGRYPVVFMPHRPAVGSAVVRLRYQRDGESAKVISLQGSVFPGGLPSTFSPGVGSYNACTVAW